MTKTKRLAIAAHQLASITFVPSCLLFFLSILHSMHGPIIIWSPAKCQEPQHLDGSASANFHQWRNHRCRDLHIQDQEDDKTGERTLDFLNLFGCHEFQSTPLHCSIHGSPHTWSCRHTNAMSQTSRSVQARSGHKLGKFQKWMENYAFSFL